jgi:uncharacterized protein YbjT (DUF2867 family)
MKRILVIGATGGIGRQVVSQLPASSVSIRALARNPQTAGLPPHVEVVRGDLTAPETLDASLDGVDGVFLLWLAPKDTVGPVLERILKQTQRIVFLSSPHKTQHPFFQNPQPNMITPLHQEIERLIEASGREWTFVRPGIFATNASFWWADQIRAGDVVRWPYAQAVTAPIHNADIAAVAVRALCEDGHVAAEYVVTGPQVLTQADQVTIIGDVIGRPLRMEEVTPEEWQSSLPDFVPPPAARMLLKAWSGTVGYPPFITTTFAEIMGVQPRTFRQWVTENAADFQARSPALV